MEKVIDGRHSGVSSGAPPSELRTALRGFVTQAIAVSLSVGWPTLVRLKVLPALAFSAGGPLWRERVDLYGSAFLGVIASLAIGDFVARRHPGRSAFVHGGIAFGGVFLLSKVFSVLWSDSFVHVYDLLWPPHPLFVLAGIWLGQRQWFHRLSLYAGLLCWPLPGAVALYFLGTELHLTPSPRILPFNLVLVSLLLFPLALVRTLKVGRQLSSPRRLK
ncbi:hypothetical protein [Hyalangium rubrum]|uniref:Uncharacterized protein n=1 Tax=Hyalangium rubrum TaxID=3103134 RepID=A0ABU5H4B8_9BACT|nr:hypothetical protein [Hyalangium sp. s54d21]MDY7228320.1 hypothetical protein [Hyalangium sp. s54d21]